MPERSIVVPATQVSRVDWTSLSLTKTPATDAAGNLIDALGSSLSFATHTYLGDPDGNPLQAIRLNSGASSRYFEKEQILAEELFGEIVTRADGTQISLLDLIDLKLTHAIPTTPIS